MGYKRTATHFVIRARVAACGARLPVGSKTTRKMEETTCGHCRKTDAYREMMLASAEEKALEEEGLFLTLNGVMP